MHKDTHKNIKDSEISENLSIKDISLSISYTKTYKLITALYMVTDMIDKEEPIRNKLRILGTEIISDMYSLPSKTDSKIAEILSFLNIASSMNFISEMNYSILKREFFLLKSSIQEYIAKRPNWLSEFFSDSSLQDPERDNSSHRSLLRTSERGNINSIGHTRIGVQKGSTLMKALSDINSNSMSFMGRMSRVQDFDELKKKRRSNILDIINTNGGNSTIKDIKDKININTNDSQIYSEKTLQRELVSMVKDGVLEKIGEKRWSKYFVKNQARI